MNMYSGSIKLLKWYAEWLHKELHFSMLPQKSRKLFVVYVGGNRQARSLGNILYKESTIFMQRKYDKYTEMLMDTDYLNV